MAFRNALKSLFSPPSGAPAASGADDPCVLLQSEAELDAAIASREKLMVLFYASWCPFSRAFLGTCRKHAAGGAFDYARIVVDDDHPLTEKYAIEVYPTVLFFEKGQFVRRLDGVYHRGLSQDQLEDFARLCAAK
jgi:thioredoxin-like negative regulator of GroEL